MFTKIEADIPLSLPGSRSPIHATLFLDAVDGTLKVEAEDMKVVDHLLNVLRVNNLLSLELALNYIEPEASNIPASYKGRRL